MHLVLPVIVVLLVADGGSGSGEKRYGQAVDLKKYPQETAKGALESFIKSVENKDIDYFVAQLADPEFVDQRVKDLGGRFEDVAKEAKQKLVDDPATLKLLRRLAEDGEWKIDDESATVKLKDEPDKPVHFVKRKERWYVKNRYVR